MNRIVSVLFLLISLQVFSQRDFLVVFKGQIKDLLDQQALMGVTLDVMQQDAVLTKVLTDERGKFYASARIQQGTTLQLRMTKGGYLVKFIAVDLSSMSGIQPEPYGYELLTNATFHLYKLKPNVDLQFATNTPTDQYTWSASNKVLSQDPTKQKEADAKAKAAYQYAIDQQKINVFLAKAEPLDQPGTFENALPFYDSILVVDPNYSKAKERKTFILKTLQEEKELAAKKAEQNNLLAEAKAAKASADYTLAEQKLNSADLILPGNPTIQAEKQAIANLKNEAKQKEANKNAFQKAWNSAQDALNKGNTTLATQYLNEAQKIQPEEKPRVEQELQKIKNVVQDKDTELKLKKILADADLQYKGLKANVTEKQLMAILEKYKQADKLIALFHKQVLIDQYSKQLQTGMKLVTDKLDNLSTVYQSQLAKANEHFENDQLPMARKVLSAPAMESRQNEPEVIDLKKKIEFKEQFLAKREGAYRTLKEGKDKTLALKALEDAQTFGQKQVAFLKTSDLPKLQKSIDSLKQILSPSAPVLKDAEVKTTPQGITLTAPGESVTESTQAFSDLYQTRMSAQENPYRQQQEIKTNIDYKNYFQQESAELGSAETTAQLNQIKDQRALHAKQTDGVQNNLQDQKVKANQETEFAITERNKIAGQQQAENAQQIQEWKDAKDFQTQQSLKEQQLNEQAGLNQMQQTKNVKELQEKALAQEGQAKLKDMNQQVQNIEYTKQMQTEQAAQNSAGQLSGIERQAASKVVLKTTPNYLRDENGVLFPTNSLTEKTYQIKNKEGFVTKVVVRRVVVDPNGHGVVFEQTTDENGKTYFTRDGQVCTEYIWFNESTGASVLQK